MDKFVGHKRVNIDSNYNYTIRVHNTDIDMHFMDYLLLLERVEVVEAGEEGFTEVCHLSSSELVECTRMSFSHLEIYRNRQVGSKEYDVLLFGVNRREMWFAT